MSAVVMATVTELRRRWGRFAEAAKDGKAICLCYHGMPQLVVLSTRRYAELIESEKKVRDGKR